MALAVEGETSFSLGACYIGVAGTRMLPLL